MSYPALPTDVNGNIIPCFWDGTAWQPYTNNMSSTVQVTSTPLIANAVFTQAWQDSQVFGVGAVSGTIQTDQLGALIVDVSNDQVNFESIQLLYVDTWLLNTLIDIPLISVGPRRYFRFRFLNSATAQTQLIVYQTQIPRTIQLHPIIRKIVTATYTDGTNVTYRCVGLLSRMAKARTYICNNGYNQPLGAIYLGGLDSMMAINNPNFISGGQISGGQIPFAGLSSGDSKQAYASMNPGYFFIHGSTSTDDINGNSPQTYITDSIGIQVAQGTTPATAGNTGIWVSETF